MRFGLAICGLMAAVLGLGGCSARYTTPGGRADFSELGLTPEAKAALTDKSVQARLEKKPLVTFPANIAVARVQAGDYTSYSVVRNQRISHTEGRYSVVTIRDVEKDTDFQTIANLPQVRGVAGMKRILLSQTLNNDEQLRAAAASLHANLLLYYTFDTEFHTDKYVRPLGVITLGIFPNHNAKVTSTASAVLMDVSNGYIYAVVEATAANNQLANAWSSEQAMDEVRRKTERQAFEQLIAEFKSEWGNVLMTYGKGPQVVPAASGQ